MTSFAIAARPLDNPRRRLSRAYRRKAWRRTVIEHELSAIAPILRLPRKILLLF